MMLRESRWTAGEISPDIEEEMLVGAEATTGSLDRIGEIGSSQIVGRGSGRIGRIRIVGRGSGRVGRINLVATPDEGIGKTSIAENIGEEAGRAGTGTAVIGAMSSDMLENREV